jgi:outer membrane protein assembly factor BamB
MKRNILILSVILISFSSVFAQVYEWRGEGRTGIYDGTGLLSGWPEKGPEILWSTLDLPTGYSSPVIAYNTIYLTGVRDSSDILTALDMKGEIKWQTPYGSAWLNNYRAGRCTPTLDNEKVYVTSGRGEVACLNAINGEIIWKVNAHKIFEGKFGRFGLAESVLIIDDKVFYTTGGSRTTMIALDKTNGNTIWTSESLNDSPAYTSPLLIEKDGIRIITTITRSYLIGVNPENGKILWKFKYSDYAGERAYNNHCNTPIYHDGSIYITSGYNHKGIKLNLTNDLSSVSINWINSELDSHHGGVVKIGDYIYGSTWDNNANGKWACVDWNTGKTLYETEWFNKGQIIAAGDYLYCYDEKFGNVGLVKATPDEFKVISSFTVTLGKRGPFWAHPVIDNGILYVRHEDAFMAYDISKK